MCCSLRFCTEPAEAAARQAQMMGSLLLQVNYNLLAVNVAMAGTGIAQLTRKIRHEYGMGNGTGQLSAEN